MISVASSTVLQDDGVQVSTEGGLNCRNEFFLDFDQGGECAGPPRAECGPGRRVRAGQLASLRRGLRLRRLTAAGFRGGIAVPRSRGRFVMSAASASRSCCCCRPSSSSAMGICGRQILNRLLLFVRASALAAENWAVTRSRAPEASPNDEAKLGKHADSCRAAARLFRRFLFQIGQPVLAPSRWPAQPPCNSRSLSSRPVAPRWRDR